MPALSWVLLALGTWLAILAAMRMCAADVKSSDHLQSEILASARRARFVNPQARRSQVGG